MHVEHWEEKDTSVSSRDSLSWPCWHFRLDEPLLGHPKLWRVFSGVPILYQLDSNSIAPHPSIVPIRTIPRWGSRVLGRGWVGGSGFWFEVSESLDQSIPWGEKLREQRGPGFSLRFQSKY